MTRRHEFLEKLIGVKEEEVTSFENMHSCLVTVTSCICVFSVFEVLSYFLYLFKVLIKYFKMQLMSLISHYIYFYLLVPPMGQDFTRD